MPDLANGPAREPRLYLPFLDGLRGIAALYVVLFHCWGQTWPIYIDPSLYPTGLTGLLTNWLGYAHYSVTVFIAISGFSLGLPVVRADGQLRGGPKAFFRRRAIRILPPYYAALLISYFVAGVLLRPHTGTSYDGNFPLTPFGFLAHVLLIHDLFPIQFQSNGPLWSVALECQIYLFFPLLVFLRRRFGMEPVLAFTYLVGFGAFWGTEDWHVQTNFYYYLLVFAMGMLAADICFGASRSTSRRYRTVVGILIIALILGGAMAHRYGPSPRQTQVFATLLAVLLLYFCTLLPRKVLSLSILGSIFTAGVLALLIRRGQSADIVVADILAGVAAACLIAVCTLKPKVWITRLLSHPMLESLGAFSYSLYLIHAPFQQLIWQTFVAPFHLRRSIGFFWMATLGTAALIGIAYLFFLAFERPFLRRTKVGTMRAAVAGEHASR